MNILSKAQTLMLGMVLPLLTACIHSESISNETLIPPIQMSNKEEMPIFDIGKPATTFALQADPRITTAYQQFINQGVAQSIKGDALITYPYDPYSKPIIACAPLGLCSIQLQVGEVINDIALGDSVHWLVSTALIGQVDNGAYQINIKPQQFDLATDMAVTTNKRAYHFGLVSRDNIEPQVVSFYYPQDSLQQAMEKARHQFAQAHTKDVVSQVTQTDVSQLNFNYQIQGKKNISRPVRIFDDGKKTFIQMPAITKNVELPVLYLVRNQQKQLVNYRYREPYYVIDGLFEKAYLISGKGKKQERVIIKNTHL